MIKIKMNVVNKTEFEDNYDYREIVIVFPRENEKLEKDFQYLGLSYANLTRQDTHITNIEIIDTESIEFSKKLTKEMQDLKTRALEDGYTMPFNDIETFYDLIKNLTDKEKTKLLAVLEVEKRYICHIRDAISYIKMLDGYVLDPDVNSKEEYATKLIENGDVSVTDIMDYIDLESLGDDYTLDSNINITSYGLLEIGNEMEYYEKLKKVKNKEDEEEFE